MSDREGVIDHAGARPAPPQFNDQMPWFTHMQHWITRILRRADAEWDGLDPDAFDPTFEEEFAESRARLAPVLHAGHA